jgi:hypothetical protein
MMVIWLWRREASTLASLLGLVSYLGSKDPKKKELVSKMREKSPNPNDFEAP